MEPFILKFEYYGKPHILEVVPVEQRYKTVYKVTVEECEITFEEDEEGFPRAVGDVHSPSWRHIEPGLLEDIGRRIAETINS